MKVFLDTPILIDMLKGHPAAVERMEQLRQSGAVMHTSTINLYEILRGIHGLPSGQERHLQAFELLASRIRVLDIDAETARKGAQIHSSLRGLGKPINENDYLIAASACANGIEVMVSQNKKHFENIKEIKQVLTY